LTDDYNDWSCSRRAIHGEVNFLPLHMLRGTSVTLELELLIDYLLS